MNDYQLPNEGIIQKKPIGVHEIDAITALKAHVFFSLGNFIIVNWVLILFKFLHGFVTYRPSEECKTTCTLSLQQNKLILWGTITGSRIIRTSTSSIKHDAIIRISHGRILKMFCRPHLDLYSKRRNLIGKEH